ncbi:MAG: hypothetical protein J5842_00385, partial [Lachnospiraceae bacterium]|nr:hypothetical protein [Lachnospiraceae bacterium]
DEAENDGEEDKQSEDLYYLSLASASLCMSEGELKYIQQPELYLKKLSGITGGDFQILFQYLCIPKISDVELCMDLMEKLIKTCSDICEDTVLPEVLSGGNKEDSDPVEKNKKALARGMLLALADNALVSREYRQGMTDIYHIRSMEDPDWKDNLTQIQRAQLILLLSQAGSTK